MRGEGEGERESRAEEDSGQNNYCVVGLHSFCKASFLEGGRRISS
jgi:hypothetical protein